MTPDRDGDDGVADVLEPPPRAEIGNTGAPLLRLPAPGLDPGGAWEGPLDLLLELARAQRVDLTQLSVSALAGQFAAAVEAAMAERPPDQVRGQGLPLHQLGDWLVMAAWLLLLRARLLLPPDSEAGQAARREARSLREQLARREAMRRLADWLARRPQLGREVFGRGRAEEMAAAHGAMPAADVTGLLRACLAVLQRPGQGGAYRPPPLALWRVPEAMVRLRQMLPTLPDGAALEHFLPPAADDQPDPPLQQRAALASTLLAGLELAREGSATIQQEAPFARVHVARTASAVVYDLQ